MIWMAIWTTFPLNRTLFGTLNHPGELFSSCVLPIFHFPFVIKHTHVYMTCKANGRSSSVLMARPTNPSRIAECLVGDETGTIVFTARNEQGKYAIVLCLYVGSWFMVGIKWIQWKYGKMIEIDLMSLWFFIFIYTSIDNVWWLWKLG